MPSALFEAIKSGDSQTVLDLIARGGADLDARGSDGPAPGDGGATCLIAAIRNFDLDARVCKALLDAGADPNLADTIDQEAPLMVAAKTYPYGHDTPGDALVSLLVAKGAKLEQKNKYGDTALHVAASSGAALQCALLIRMGANPAAKDVKGKTALQIAQDVATQSSIEEAMDAMHA